MAETAMSIERARRAFFENGALPVADLRQPVLRSWLRCADAGLAARRSPPIEPVEATRLRELQQLNEGLIRLCRPELETLSAEARETGSVVILTDGEGMILDAIGDPGFRGQAERVALRPGVSWRESITGTNAIGVALAERRPSAVNGGEHFFSSHRVLSCAAMPILDPRGAILGVLDMSGPSEGGMGHALGMVRMAVDQVEHRLFNLHFDGCRVLRFHEDAAMLGTSREGILVFREERLVAGNRRGLSLVGRGWDALDELSFEQLFEEREAHGDRVRLARLSGGEVAATWTGGEPEPASTSLPLAEIEEQTLRRVHAETGGNVSETARRLGIHRSTVHRRLRH